MTTIADLLEAMCIFEEREQADPIQIALFADGSGEVMAVPDSPYETGECLEGVFSFDTIEELADYLKSGKLPLPEDGKEPKDS